MTLRKAIEQYIAWRQAHGTKFHSGAVLLHLFLNSIDGEINCDAVTDEQSLCLSRREGSPEATTEDEALGALARETGAPEDPPPAVLPHIERDARARGEDDDAIVEALKKAVTTGLTSDPKGLIHRELRDGLRARERARSGVRADANAVTATQPQTGERRCKQRPKR